MGGTLHSCINSISRVSPYTSANCILSDVYLYTNTFHLHAQNKPCSPVVLSERPHFAHDRIPEVYIFVQWQVFDQSGQKRGDLHVDYDLCVCSCTCRDILTTVTISAGVALKLMQHAKCAHSAPLGVPKHNLHLQ